ncbi:MAG TPA: hypothetical protein VM263_00555 [Acidimicrobiales bacterium]|nr:hypothetical protein [Acidimicrobiales bacterium]
MSKLLRHALVAAVAVACPAVLAAPRALGGAGNGADRSAGPVTVAVIGDVPYGAAQEERAPVADPASP